MSSTTTKFWRRCNTPSEKLSVCWHAHYSFRLAKFLVSLITFDKKCYNLELCAFPPWINGFAEHFSISPKNLLFFFSSKIQHRDYFNNNQKAYFAAASAKIINLLMCKFRKYNDQTVELTLTNCRTSTQRTAQNLWKNFLRPQPICFSLLFASGHAKY